VRVRLERAGPGGAWRGVATRPAGRRRARPALTFDSAPDGSFSRRLPGRAPRRGSFRLAWRRPDGTWEAGPAQPVQPLPTRDGLVQAR
ncbi:MAG TPA: hypothetical protein VNB64_03065, partial [Solirubrobacteraceae bacterium]|nr:hypothetical protein [Solirubrobacteraceae bacterium]